MTRRERRLTLVVVSFAGAFALFGAGKRFVLGPLREADGRTQELEDSLRQHLGVYNRALQAQAIVEQHGRRAFGTSVEETSARIGEYLTERIADAGLDDRRFSRVPSGMRQLTPTPAGGSSMPTEVGWSIQGVGPIGKIVDLLFRLDSDTRLHRIENLTVGMAESVAERTVSFRFLALVLKPPRGVEILNAKDAVKIDDAQRKLRDGIARRALFRPYVKRPPPPPTPPPTPPPAPPPAPPPPGPETFRVISLSEWRGEPEVLVLDTTENRTTKYHTGDALAGGKVVMVDYRPLPSPRKPELRSLSRVIISTKDELWAVESGDTLADKYRLADERVPSQLKHD